MVTAGERADTYAGRLPVRIPGAELKRLSQVDPWRSTLHIALEWGAILLCASLCWRFWHPLLYVLSVVFIGARQHALLILMHDGSHLRLFRSRRVNDWLTEVFLAWPFVAFSMRDYRRSHFAHHRFVNSDRDPDWMRKRNRDWAFPMGPLALTKLLVSILLGGGIARQLGYARNVSRAPEADAQSARQPDPLARELTIGRIVFLAASAALLVVLDLWLPFLLFWVVPFATWTQLALHLRSIAEHFAIPEGEGMWGDTRNTLPGVLDRIFLGSKNIGYHIDHHLYPSVPFHRLPELHALLMRDPRYRGGAHQTRGYWRVLRECVTARPLEVRGA